MEYCCSGFECATFIGNGFAQNIRIVRFVSEVLVSQNFNRAKRKRNDLRYFITSGYETFSLDLPLMNINFCPYCGVDLYRFYTEDKYVNEIEGETFFL